MNGFMLSQIVNLLMQALMIAGLGCAILSVISFTAYIVFYLFMRAKKVYYRFKRRD